MFFFFSTAHEKQSIFVFHLYSEFLFFGFFLVSVCVAVDVSLQTNHHRIDKYTYADANAHEKEKKEEEGKKKAFMPVLCIDKRTAVMMIINCVWNLS